jgi:hypothetical protein
MRDIDWAKAFGEPGTNDESVSAYLRDLRENWRALEDSLHRTGLIVIVLGLAFVLIGSDGVGEVSIGGVTITNLLFVLASLPVAIAYFFLVMSLDVGLLGALGTTHDDAYHYYFRGFHDQDLETTLRPSQSISAVRAVSSRSEGRWVNNLMGSVAAIRLIAYVAGPLIFEIYALVTLWRSPDVPTLWATIATTLTAFLLLACVPTLLVLVDMWL